MLLNLYQLFSVKLTVNGVNPFAFHLVLTLKRTNASNKRILLVPREDLGKIGRDPSVSKFNRSHVGIFHFLFIIFV